MHLSTTYLFMNKKTLFVIIGAIVLIGVGILLSNSSDTQSKNETVKELGDPRDTVSEFYGDWKRALESTSTDPQAAGLYDDPRLSAEVQAYLRAYPADTALDPALCLSIVPPRIGAKPVFTLEDTAQFIVFPGKVDAMPERALVDVAVVDGMWKITKIDCISGESAPDVEFTFDREGSLLKSDQAPLSGDTWYLIFEENGKDGHFAPLFFDEQSMCLTNDSEAICDPGTFINPSTATVKGEMTEAGVEVKRVEF